MPLRIDSYSGLKVQRTLQGGVRLDGVVSRVGVVSYFRNGRIVRELRPPEEVFKPESLATLEAAPIIVGHPPERRVRADSWKRHAVGHQSNPHREGDMDVVSTVYVQDAEAAQKVLARELTDASPGYDVDIDPTPGVWNGERYDQIQRNIRYNHTAIIPPGSARQKGASLRLDSEDGIMTACNPPTRTPQGRQSMKTVVIDGVTYEVGSESHLQAQQRLDQKRSEELAAERAEKEKLQGRLDSIEKERDELKKQVEEATSPARLDSLVSERFELLDGARKVLGQVDLGGKSSREVHEMVVKAVDPEARLDSLSDDRLAGRFEAIVQGKAAGAPAGGTVHGARRAFATMPTGPNPPEGNTRTDQGPKDSRGDFIKRSRAAYQQPLSVTKG